MKELQKLVETVEENKESLNENFIEFLDEFLLKQIMDHKRKNQEDMCLNQSIPRQQKNS
jgi:hypothetical protein